MNRKPQTPILSHRMDILQVEMLENLQLLEFRMIVPNCTPPVIVWNSGPAGSAHWLKLLFLWQSDRINPDLPSTHVYSLLHNDDSICEFIMY